jgi:hypothetical protein
MGAHSALGEHLEQQLGAAPAEFDATQLVEAEQAGAAVASDGLGQPPAAVAVSSAPLFTLPSPVVGGRRSTFPARH